MRDCNVRRWSRHNRGFTLIEMMVVVAIILLLIGILIPVLAAARRNARAADTQTQLASLASACQGYSSLFQLPPGPIAEKDLAADMGYSGAQNLTLGLTGMLSIVGDNELIPSGGNFTRSKPIQTYKYYPLPATSRPDFSIYAVLAPTAIKDMGKSNTLPPLYNPRSGDLKVVASDWTPTARIAPFWGNGYGAQLGAYPYVNAPLLTYVDRYTDPLPILYFRRNAGATSPVLSENSATPAAYYRAANIGYLGAAAGSPINITSPSGRICPQQATAAQTAQLQNSMTDAASNSARGGFILISAGEDRIYGTADDIVVTGGN